MDGQRIFILGGSSGIGLEVARQARERGANLTIAGRDREKLAAAAAALDGYVEMIVVDAHEGVALERLFAAIQTVDHVVSMVGDSMAGGFLATSADTMRHVLQSKFWTNWTIARFAAPRIAPGGSLTFTSGTGGRPHDIAASYVANQGIAALVQGLASELAPDVRVNAVAPTFMGADRRPSGSTWRRRNWRSPRLPSCGRSGSGDSGPSKKSPRPTCTSCRMASSQARLWRWTAASCCGSNPTLEHSPANPELVGEILYSNSERQTFAVVGATGSVGRVVAQRLRDQGHHVHAVARSTGVSLDDAGALRSAFGSVDRAFVMIPFDVQAPDLHQREDEIGLKLATVLADARVRRLVFLSGTSAHLGDRAGSAMGAAMMEERLDRLRIPELMHLRGAFFMENLLQGVREIAETGVFTWAFRGDRPTPMVAATDVGKRAAELLMARSFDEGNTDGGSVQFGQAAAPLTASSLATPRVQEVLGPRDYTLAEAARILGNAIGRPEVGYAQASYDEARRAMTSAGMSASFADAVMDTARSFNDGQVWAKEARSPHNTTTTTLEQFAAEVFSPAYEAVERSRV